MNKKSSEEFTISLTKKFLKYNQNTTKNYYY